MASAEIRNMRLSQTLVPFGVGAIYDFRGESLIACDISYWKGRGHPIRSRRLAAVLNVEGFRAAPSQISIFGASSTPGVPYFRFPQWLFCQRCRSMVRWSTKMEVNDEPAKCRSCSSRPQLVPMRFVVACRNGHLGDVPWEFWAHFGTADPHRKNCKSRDLKFIALAGSGAGLESLRVECRTCGAKRSLAGITSKDTVRAMKLRCPGKQPWQYIEGHSTCGEDPLVLQRGASNLYFATVKSAIDIPPESLYDEFGELTLAVTNHQLYQVVKSDPKGALVEAVLQTMGKQLNCSPDQIRVIVEQELKGIEGTRAGGASDLETDEWRAFTTRQDEHGTKDRFVTRHVPLLTDPDRQEASTAIHALDGLIGMVVLATKLREVRAFVGFNRYEISEHMVAPDLGRKLSWLPAIEVFGEGIFFTLREDALGEWEKSPGVVEACQKLEKRRQAHFIGRRLKPGRPRFILLHTLAHLLIRQLSFQCGYSSASLRERIYAGGSADEPQAGILIYTAAGDVEGTLGGLVRQGQPPDLAHTILSALEAASWCSSDPICIESPGQGFGTLNLGACHACSLVAETSCENANVLLDRGLVVGVPGRVVGFFENVLSLAAANAAETVEADSR
jgi:hypothetical protein